MDLVGDIVDQIHLKDLDSWKRYRWLATVLVNVSGKTVKKKVKETDLLKFPQDRAKAEELKQVWQKIRK